MKSLAWMALAVVLALQSACARKDWIEQTLVTTDVTGTWIGSMLSVGVFGTAEIRLELEQQGSKVTGYFRALPPHHGSGLVNGPLEGTVAGDVFTFKQTNGVLMGETTINGDEMRLTMTATQRMTANLRRVNSDAPARSQ